MGVSLPFSPPHQTQNGVHPQCSTQKDISTYIWYDREQPFQWPVIVPGDDAPNTLLLEQLLWSPCASVMCAQVHQTLCWHVAVPGHFLLLQGRLPILFPSISFFLIISRDTLEQASSQFSSSEIKVNKKMFFLISTKKKFEIGETGAPWTSGHYKHLSFWQVYCPILTREPSRECFWTVLFQQKKWWYLKACVSYREICVFGG